MKSTHNGEELRTLPQRYALYSGERNSPLNSIVKQADANVTSPIADTRRVLITNTDRWAGPARLAMSLSKVGFEVSALCPVHGHPMSKTRCVRQVLPYDGYRPLQALIHAIEQAQPHLVVPCDDLGVRHLHDLHTYALENSLGDLLVLLKRSLGPVASYPVVSARYDLLKMAREEGILAPETNIVTCSDDLKTLEQTSGYPLVLKADGTWGGRGVRIAHDSEQAEKAFVELSQPPAASKLVKRLLLDRDRSWLRSWWCDRPPVITAQSYVTGRPANCAVVCWEGKVLAGISVEVICSQELTGPSTLVRVVESPEMMFAAERLASRLLLSGFFGLDFMIDDDNNSTYLIEMNPRCTPLCHLQLGPGQDLVSALYAQLTDGAGPSTPPLTKNPLIAYYPQTSREQSELLQASFYDVPEGEPELMEDLLHPWTGRSLFGRAVDKLRPAALQRRAPKPCVFEAALADLSIKS